MFVELVNESGQAVFQSSLSMVAFSRMWLSDKAVSVLLHGTRALSLHSMFCATWNQEQAGVTASLGLLLGKGLVPHQHLSLKVCQQDIWKWMFLSEHLFHSHRNWRRKSPEGHLVHPRDCTRKIGWSKTASSRHAHKTAFQSFLEWSDCTHIKVKTQCKHSLQNLRENTYRYVIFRKQEQKHRGILD